MRGAMLIVGMILTIAGLIALAYYAPHCSSRFVNIIIGGVKMAGC